MVIPTPGFGGSEEGLGVESITSGQWFNQSCLCIEAPIKTWKEGMQRASRLGKQKASACSLAGPKLHEDRSSFGTSPCVSLSNLAVDSCSLIYFVINCWSSEYVDFLSSLSHSSKLIEPKERGSWEPLTYSPSIRSTGNNLDLWTACEVGVSFVGLSF